MPYKPGREPVEPDYKRLVGTLNRSGIREKDHALYQVIKSLIDWGGQSKNFTQAQIERIDQDIADLPEPDGGNVEAGADPDLTYITVDDETDDLPNSVQIIAGPGITLDTSVPGELTISATGSIATFYDSPLTDGDLDETDLIFANGDCIIVQVPV